MNISKNKLIIAGIFAAGIIAGMALLLLAYSQRNLLGKIKGKLKAYYIAHIPQKTKPLTINDFESQKDIDLFKTTHAAILLAKREVTSGASNARIDFYPSSEASGIILKQPFQKDKKLRDWGGYESLAFDIYNPETKAIEIKLKLRDTGDNSRTESVYISPQEVTPVFLDISQWWGEINPSRIAQMNIFLWNTKEEHTLYIDNLRLVPERHFEGEALAILGEPYLPKPGEEIYAAGNYNNFDSQRPRWLVNNRVRVPVYVNNPSQGERRGVPVSGGIPLPQGELASMDKIRILDNNANVIPAQVRPLGYWGDKSIKWLQVDTRLDLAAGQRQIGYLEYPPGRAEGLPTDAGGAGEMISKQETLTMEESKNQITVNTGVLKFVVKRQGFRLLDTVWLDTNQDGRFSDEEMQSQGSDMVIVHRGQEYRSSLDKKYTLTVEEKGALKATLKAEGWFTSKSKKQFCRFIVRLQAFAGESFVRVYHTFIYTGYPENKYHYLYKGKWLPKNETIEAVSIETPLSSKGDLSYALAEEKGQSLQGPLTQSLFVIQDTSRTFHVTANNRSHPAGQRLAGWLDISRKDAGVSVIIKDFWQQFPKGWQFDAKRRVLKTELWPRESGELDLKTTAAAFGDDAVARGSAFGLGKTHELAFYFHAGAYDDSKDGPVVKLLGTTILLSAAPAWISDTLALGKVKAYDERLKPLEETAEMIFDWAQRHIVLNDWYGMIDFGDVITSREESWRRDGRHGWFNNEAMGVHSGALMQYLRTGKYKYLAFAEASTRHIMDVDTVHYNTVAHDKRLRGVISDDYSQVGSQHRHNADHWGGRNEETSHTNLHGILLYYYMTGYERAWDVAKEIGEFFLKERMTYFHHPDICPQRNVSNVLWGAVEMFEATQDERYKKLADKWADVLFRGQRHDGIWLETYNPLSRRWEGEEHVLYTLSYTLPALVAYHKVTGNKAIAESIVKATQYYMEHKPYNPFLETLSYSYYLTGNPIFLETGRERVDYYIKHQRRNTDPLENGMIYQKASYARVMEFLYQFPFGFQILEEKGNGGRGEKNNGKK